MTKGDLYRGVLVSNDVNTETYHYYIYDRAHIYFRSAKPKLLWNMSFSNFVEFNNCTKYHGNIEPCNFAK